MGEVAFRFISGLLDRKNRKVREERSRKNVEQSKSFRFRIQIHFALETIFRTNIHKAKLRPKREYRMMI